MAGQQLDVPQHQHHQHQHQHQHPQHHQHHQPGQTTLDHQRMAPFDPAVPPPPPPPRRDSNPMPSPYYPGSERHPYYLGAPGPATHPAYPGGQPLTTWTTAAPAQPQV